MTFILPLALSSSPTLLGVTPVSVIAYRRHPPLAFLYGAAASVMLSLSPSMASQSIPLMTFIRKSTCQTARFTFTYDDVRNNLTATGVPQLYFDQLNHIRHHLDGIRSPLSPTARKLTRRTLAGTADWPEWEASEYKQLNQFAQQGMFADPIPAPPDASVFRWV
jgi:hypothetical protein